MKRLILVWLCLAICPLVLRAQSNFKPGLVVTAAGDTLRGFVDYREWNETPTALNYATGADGSGRQTFDAGTALYVEITGLEKLQRYKGPVSMNELEISKLTTSRDLYLAEQQVFLRQIASGPHVRLLSYTDRIKTRYFMQEKSDSLPQELYFVKYYTPNTGNKTKAMKSYAGQLLMMAARHVTVTPELKREIETANYAAKPLQQIVNQVNGVDHAASAAVEKLRSKPRLFAGAALSSTRMQFSGNDAMATSDPSVSFMPRLAVGLDAFVNRNTQRLLLRVEGALTASSHTFKNTTHSSVYDYHQTYHVAQQTASFIPQVIYNVYNRDDRKVYLGGGLSLNFTNYSTNDYSYTYSSGSTTYGAFELDEKKLEPFWSSVAVRTGVVLNRRYEFTAVYQPKTRVTKYFDFAVEHQSLSLGVNYLFSK